MKDFHDELADKILRKSGRIGNLKNWQKSKSTVEEKDNQPTVTSNASIIDWFFYYLFKYWLRMLVIFIVFYEVGSLL